MYFNPCYLNFEFALHTNQSQSAQACAPKFIPSVSGLDVAPIFSCYSYPHVFDTYNKAQKIDSDLEGHG